MTSKSIQMFSAGYDFIKDPEHKHYPGVAYHRTKTGWSNAVKPKRKDEGEQKVNEVENKKPVIRHHEGEMTDDSVIVEGLCNGNYFHVAANLKADSEDEYTAKMISSTVSHTVLENHLDPSHLGREGYLKILRGLADRFQVMKVHLYQSMERD